jgi:hypothetical protein
MRNISFANLKQRLKSGLVAALFIGAQAGAVTVPFLNASVAHAAPTCVNDTAGANDEPGQKDLTRLCADYANVGTGTITTTWQWDELGTNGANTMDACNLFDTDNDGFINYAVCETTIDKPAIEQSTITYLCGDDKIDRCTTPTSVQPNGSTDCSVAVINTGDPFPAGSDYPKDTQGTCIIDLTTVGGVTAKLVDVCSYPSSQPNSDPSDCVITRDKAGKLEVLKNLIPGTDTGKFNLQIDGTTKATDVGNNGTTGEVVVSEGNHTVGELAGTGTNLSSYTSSIECRTANGTGAVVASGSGTSLVVPIVDQTDVVCVITNTASGSITIVKDAQPNSAQDFAFTATGSGVSGFNLDDDADPTLSNTKTFTGLNAGAYSFAETPVAGWDLTSSTCSDGSTVANVQLSAGENITCTFTNVQRGHLIVQKTTVPAADPTVFSITASGSGTITDGGAGTVSDATDQSYEVTPGTYSVAETVPAGWSKTGDTCQNVVVAAGATTYCTLTNTKLGSLTIIKNALPDDAQDFTFSVTNLAGGNFLLDDDADPTLSNQKVFSNLLPGSYSVTEQSTPGWSLTGLNCDGNPVEGSTANVNLAAGQNSTCTFTNTKLGSISGTKFIVNADGGVTADQTAAMGWTINLILGGNVVDSTQTDANGNYSFSDLLIGQPYSIAEVLETGWTQITSGLTCTNDSPITLTAGQNSTDNDFCNFENGSISGFKWNDKNGDGDVDGGEEHLNGWTITLYNDGEDEDTALDDVVATGVTGVDGNYSFTDLAPGTYAVCETQQTNWVQTYPAGNTCHTIVINLSGETNQANFGNQGRGNIVVVKNVDTDGDGTVDEQDVTNWNWNINEGNDNFATGSGNAQNVAAGDYTVSEVQLPNYHVTASSCSGEDAPADATTTLNVTVGVGETVTCTFTNTRDTATITIVKDAIPFEGDTSDQAFNFNFDEDSFSLADNGVADDNTKTYNFVKTGESYDISEDATEGWTLDGVVCSNDQEESELSRSLLSLLSGNVTEIENGITVTPEANEHITCTFTNTRDTGTITVVKKLTPSTNEGKFNLNINGEVYASNVGDGGTTPVVALPTGTYTASETAGTNTVLSDYESSYSCKDGDTVVLSGNGTSIPAINLAKGQNIVCTFSNNKGEILGAVAPVLVNTGANTLVTSLASLLLITAVGGLSLATRRSTSRK